VKGEKRMKKKVVIKVDIPVALTELELLALQAALDSKRKPTERQVVKHFEQVIDEAIEQLLEEHGVDPDDGEGYA